VHRKERCRLTVGFAAIDVAEPRVGRHVGDGIVITAKEARFLEAIVRDIEQALKQL
jgi:hypothetical protein